MPASVKRAMLPFQNAKHQRIHRVIFGIGIPAEPALRVAPNAPWPQDVVYRSSPGYTLAMHRKFTASVRYAFAQPCHYNGGSPARARIGGNDPRTERL